MASSRIFSNRIQSLPSKYDYSRAEAAIRNRVCGSDPNASRFLILPPPNVTGQLHIGHAFNAVLQDVHVRSMRLVRNESLTWVPGFDHAGIAGHLAALKALSKGDVRNTVNQTHVRLWTDARRRGMREQLKCLNLKLCWDREYYTLDDKFSCLVNNSFRKLYEQQASDGLPYIRRQERLVNWSVHLQTTLSDAEVKVEHVPVGKYRLPCGRSVRVGRMFVVKYELLDTVDAEFVEVATRRPETIFGDVALAVHPDDHSKNYLIGRRVMCPLTNQYIPIVGDYRVDPNNIESC